MSFRIEMQGDVAELDIYGPIGDQFNGEDPTQLLADLRTLEADKLVIHLNSPGGDVFSGFQIYNRLEALDMEIETINEGLAASVAGVIYLAGDSRVAAAGSRYMLHMPYARGVGGAEELEAQAQQLRVTTGEAIKVYSQKTGHAEDTIREMMEAETWLGPADAVRQKFATSTTSSFATAACVDWQFANEMFAAPPTDLMESIKPDHLSAESNRVLAELDKIKSLSI